MMNPWIRIPFVPLVMAGLIASVAVGPVGAVPCQEDYHTDLPSSIKDPNDILGLATADNNFKCVQEAVASGADVNLRFRSGRPPLFAAASVGNLQIIQFLIDHGAHVNFLDWLGYPVLGSAKNVQTAQLLIKAGARLDYRTVLWSAIQNDFALTRHYLSLMNPSEDTKQYLFSDYKKAGGTNRDMLRLIASWPKEMENFHAAEIDRSWKNWTEWVRLGWIPNVYWPEPSEKFLAGTLLKSFEAGKPVQAPPKTAPMRLRQMYRYLRKANENPERLDASSLNVDGGPVYLSMILKIAMKAESKAPNRFQPDRAQALRTAQALLVHEGAQPEDMKAAEWILNKTGVSIQTGLLDELTLSAAEARQQAQMMMNTQAMKFQSVPNLIALKLTKVLLGFSKEDFKTVKEIDYPQWCAWAWICNPPVKEYSSTASNLLALWISYGDLPDADKSLFASIARIIMERISLPEIDRNELLRTMKAWAKEKPGLQYDLALAIAQSIGDKPVNQRSFQEQVFVSQAVGLRSELSFGAWLAQMRAFGELRAKRGGGPLRPDEKDMFAGLLKYFLGQPGVDKSLSPDDFDGTFDMAAEEPKKGGIRKLCRVLKTNLAATGSQNAEGASLAQGINLWLQLVRENLDQPRMWPELVELDEDDSFPTLREELKAKDLKHDLEALVENCSKVDIPSFYQDQKSVHRIKHHSRSSHRRRHRNSSDFEP